MQSSKIIRGEPKGVLADFLSGRKPRRPRPPETTKLAVVLPKDLATDLQAALDEARCYCVTSRNEIIAAAVREAIGNLRKTVEFAKAAQDRVRGKRT